MVNAPSGSDASGRPCRPDEPPVHEACQTTSCGIARPKPSVGTGEAQGGQPQQESDRRGEGSRDEQRREERQPQAQREQGGGVRADREEAGVSQRDLAGVPDEESQADGDDRVDESERDQIEDVSRGDAWDDIEQRRDDDDGGYADAVRHHRAPASSQPAHHRSRPTPS